MPRPLTNQDVIERLHIHTLEGYALIANVAKGIALSVGGLALLAILGAFSSQWVRLLPWAASMASVLLSYVKWSRGTLLSNARGNVWDSFFPLLMGVEEFLLFAILVSGNDTPPSIIWLNWPLCLAAHALTAAALVSNRLRVTNLQQDFAAEIAGLGREYQGWLKADCIQASFGGSVALVVWLLGRLWILPSYGTRVWSSIVGVLAAVAFVAAWKPIHDANTQRNRIDEFVSQSRAADGTPYSPQKMDNQQTPATGGTTGNL